MPKAIAFALCLALIWGSSFPISQLGIEQIGALPFRVSVIFISTVTLITCSYRHLISYLKKSTLAEIASLSLLSVPNIFLVPLINNISLVYLPVSTATILIYMMPCFVSLLTMMAEKKVNLISLCAILLCSSGIFILSGFDNFHIGEYLMIVNALIWAIGAFMSQRIVFKHIPLITTVCIQMIATLVMTLMTYVVWVWQDHAIINLFKTDTLFTIPTIFSVFYIGIVGSAVVYYFWFRLIELKSAEYTSYATLLSPVISIAIAVTILREEITNTTILGGSLILISSFIMIMKPLVSRYWMRNQSHQPDKQSSN